MELSDFTNLKVDLYIKTYGLSLLIFRKLLSTNDIFLGCDDMQVAKCLNVTKQNRKKKNSDMCGMVRGTLCTFDLFC